MVSVLIMVIIIVKYNKLTFTELFFMCCIKHLICIIIILTTILRWIVLSSHFTENKTTEIEQLGRNTESFCRCPSSLFYFLFFGIYLFVLFCYLSDLSNATLQCNKIACIRTQFPKLSDKVSSLPEGLWCTSQSPTDLFKNKDL